MKLLADSMAMAWPRLCCTGFRIVLVQACDFTTNPLGLVVQSSEVWSTDCESIICNVYLVRTQIMPGTEKELQKLFFQRVKVPTAVAQFPKEILIAPPSWCANSYNLCRYTKFKKVCKVYIVIFCRTNLGLDQSNMWCCGAGWPFCCTRAARSISRWYCAVFLTWYRRAIL